jgi:hypothetical protein
MPTAPTRYTKWLTANKYHPRSNKHGNALCEYVLEDLLKKSSLLRAIEKKGALGFAMNHAIQFAVTGAKGEIGDLTWNADLVIGLVRKRHRKGSRASPSRDFDRYLFAMDAKGIMTEHGKARRNRQRDLVAFSQIMRAFRSKIITAGVVPINAAKTFRSQVNNSELKQHPDNLAELVDDSISLFRAIRVLKLGGGTTAVDAVATFVLDYTNDHKKKRKPRAVLTGHRINKSTGDVASYRAFLTTVDGLIKKRFGKAIGAL